MRMLARLSITTLPALALIACAPPPPPPPPVVQAAAANAGVGFNNPEAYRAARAEREAQLRDQPPAYVAPATPEALPPPIIELPGGTSEPLESASAADALDPSVLEAVERIDPQTDVSASSAVIAAPVPVRPAMPVVLASADQAAALPLAPAPQPTADGFVTDANYVQVSAEALPERPESNVNVVSYALATTNAVGQPVYKRGRSFSRTKFERACGEFRSDDAAQVALLAAGGPERDRLGIDPDGDGFACAWSPAPFRAAAGR